MSRVALEEQSVYDYMASKGFVETDVVGVYLLKTHAGKVYVMHWDDIFRGEVIMDDKVTSFGRNFNKLTTTVVDLLMNMVQKCSEGNASITMLELSRWLE